MNKKKLAIILGSIFLVLIAIYLILNPAWITHPKYMIDSQYCEVDNECITYGSGRPVNIYYPENTFFHPSFRGGYFESCGNECKNNKCTTKSCESAQEAFEEGLK
ncbi:hypothetical protein H6501_01515 [Candidatus Woesearchaeota archaeon]|nr:hypothetical protein [Candidatus Woesearchaeota archaeon]USN44778.1 MAG: hypothetical protein H6500_02965 [Candidatus Woesearchaeota archaeon]